MKNFRTKEQLTEQINDLKALKGYAIKHPANKLRPNFIPGLNEMIKEVKQQLKNKSYEQKEKDNS
jgi:hypothetical protein